MEGEQQPKNLIRISKTLSFLLRHGAEKEKIPIRSDGYCLVKDLLSYRKLQHCTFDDITTIVAQDSKTRFALSQIDTLTGLIVSDEEGAETTSKGSREWCIRANQGHSISMLEKVEMSLIQSADEIPTVVHGTYRHIWPTIQAQGLSKMNRLHIHFATGLFQDINVKSGMRKSANVFIYIDAGKAMQDGIIFYRSANNVILSSGNSDGFILPQYFEKVVNSKGESLL